MWDSTFSTTTMASSTTRPMARTIAKRVNVLMEKPKMIKLAKVPIRDTGIAKTGIRVALQLWRKRNTMMITKASASLKVCTTSPMDSEINSVLSMIGTYFISSGKSLEASSNTFFTSPMVSMALASSVNLIPKPAAGAPSQSEITEVVLAPVSTFATSLRYIQEPS